MGDRETGVGERKKERDGETEWQECARETGV